MSPSEIELKGTVRARTLLTRSTPLGLAAAKASHRPAWLSPQPLASGRVASGSPRHRLATGHCTSAEGASSARVTATGRVASRSPPNGLATDRCACPEGVVTTGRAASRSPPQRLATDRRAFSEGVVATARVTSRSLPHRPATARCVSPERVVATGRAESRSPPQRLVTGRCASAASRVRSANARAVSGTLPENGGQFTTVLDPAQNSLRAPGSAQLAASCVSGVSSPCVPLAPSRVMRGGFFGTPLCRIHLVRGVQW